MRCGLPSACMFTQALQCNFLRVGVARACHILVHSSSGFAAQLQRAPACFRARTEKLGSLDPSLQDTIVSLPADEVIAIFKDVSSGLTMDGYSVRDFYLLSTSHEPALPSWRNCRWRNARSWLNGHDRADGTTASTRSDSTTPSSG